MTERKVKMDGVTLDPEKVEWFNAWKRPVKIQAVDLPMPYEVETMEGTMEADGGDILIRGVEDELYPCDKNIFNQTYIVNDGNVPKYTDRDINRAKRELSNYTLDHVPTGVTDTDARAGARAFIKLLKENGQY